MLAEDPAALPFPDRLDLVLQHDLSVNRTKVIEGRRMETLTNHIGHAWRWDGEDPRCIVYTLAIGSTSLGMHGSRRCGR